MGETLEENWISEPLNNDDNELEEESEQYHRVKSSTSTSNDNNNNNNNNNMKQSRHSNNKKRPASKVFEKQSVKKRKEKGLRSFATSEDQGMLSTNEKTMSETFWKHYIKAMGKELTELEKFNLLAINNNAFAVCRNEAGWKNCGIIIKAGLPNWKKKLSAEEIDMQSPRVVVICGSANRALALIKEIRNSMNGQFFVGKFFSRHIKLKQNIQMLNENEGKNVPIIVGTPGRIYKLVDEKHLLLTGTDLLIIDMSRDCK